jgi:ABC transport system ATP-binding/permease protein
MPLLSIRQASLAFGLHALLDSADFSIEAGERIGLIGRNGTGKSSLLKCLTGQIQLDDGEIIRQGGVTTAYVAQEPELDADSSVLDNVAKVVEATGLHEEWAITPIAQSFVSRFDLPEDALVSTLSGGQRKRVSLAQAFALEPDLLLLDEPTNHLDIESIQWLEKMVINLRCALILITHDRSFLDAVSTRVVELDRGRLMSFPGSFSAYQTLKADQTAYEEVVNAKFDKLLAQEEVWVRQGVKARLKRNEGRVRRLEALRAQREARRDRTGSVKLALDAGERSGKLVAELVDVSKSYGESTILSGVNTIIQRGDKVGIVGPNGAGKTTLLRVILGELEADSGTIRLGSNRQVAYYDQLRTQLDITSTVANTISPGSEWVEIGGTRLHVMAYLERFLFAPQRAQSPVSSLSGGERNRLLLAQLFARPANVLVLDEPTNDLDIDTLELLEELLAEYSGTVLLVSHDRAFLDGVVTQTLAFEGEGRWQEYPGGYTDLLAARERIAKAQAKSDSQSSQPPGKAAGSGAPTLAAAPAAPKKSKLNYNEQRELSGLPAKIAALEAEQKALDEQMSKPDFYTSASPADVARIQAATERRGQIEEALLAALERWEALDGR